MAKTACIQKRMATQTFGYFLHSAMKLIQKNSDFDIVSCDKLEAQM